MQRSRVDLPEPLWPTRAYIDPWGISRETSLSAQNWSTPALRSRRVTSSLSEWARSVCSLKRLDTPSTTMALIGQSSSITVGAQRPKITQPPTRLTTAATTMTIQFVRVGRPRV